MRLFFTVIFMFTIFCNSFAESLTFVEKKAKEINGVQLFVLDEKYKDDLDSLMKGFKERGVNTVFLRVFHNTGSRYHFKSNPSECKNGVYFKTEKACVIDDLLGKAVESAKKYDLDVYAWMATRTLSFLRSKKNMEYAFAGKNKIKYGYGVNFLVPDVREDIVQLFRDLAKYNIKGILFQDDYILKYREGASKRSLFNYEQHSGVRLSDEKLFACNDGLSKTKVPKGCEEYFLPWQKWKNSVLMEFFSELKKETLKINPEIRFAANVYYETAVDDDKGMSWYAQTIDKLDKAGFDYFAVMCYHDQISGELRKNIKGTLNYINRMLLSLTGKIKDRNRIIMKLQRESFRKDSRVKSSDFNSVCSLVKSYKGVSRVIVPVDRAEEAKPLCFVK